MINYILANKPVLVGLHLGFAILGIDALLWLAGEVLANSANRKRIKIASYLAIFGFVASWVVGGYYYVTYYGKLVKPEILKGTAPWAHAVAMEAKEHIFLLLVPMVCLILCSAMLSREDLNKLELKKPLLILIFVVAGAALSLGLMGYIISAAARWG